jgi:broad specificity phosphatase PhoE
VYASPLARTRATAAAIARYNGAPVSVDARFIEFNFAQYDGTRSKDLPDELKGQWFDRPHLLSVPDGDNMQEFGPRVFAALLALAQENKGKTVAVATHGNVLRAIGLRLQHMPEDRLIDVAWSGNTGVHLVRFDDNGNWEYLLKNDTSHVPLAFAGPLERGNR